MINVSRSGHRDSWPPTKEACVCVCVSHAQWNKGALKVEELGAN